MHRELLARLLALATLVLVLAGVVLFAWQQERRVQALAGAVDPASWAQQYPQHYASFLRSAQSDTATAHGGNLPTDLLAANPFRARAFAGYSFALEYTAARGHVHALQDQLDSRRTRELRQPAGCINCHAAEAPQLIASMGSEALHALDYDDVKDSLHHGSSCSDCHDSGTMDLTITRPALREALQAQGIDVAGLSRQDLRSYVCAQCHVEYYFRGEGELLAFPWTQGRRLEDIEAHYDAAGHTDWLHAESGAPLLKAQHPETELAGRGVHAARGVACADCHMPRVQEDGVSISDHWIRSPLLQVEAACLGCHRRGTAESLQARVVAIQDATLALATTAETELAALIDAIVAARASSAPAAAVAAAQQAQRRAQFRWDFVDAENSTGFHASLEAQRLLTDAAAQARAGREALAAAVAGDATAAP